MSEEFDPAAPVHVAGLSRAREIVVTCDHATNRIPSEIGSLGVPDADMVRHIAYDIGALGAARALGEALDAPVVNSNFSRLVIDPNRGADDPTLIMQLYDGSIIPGNRALSAADRAYRLEAYYQPYDAALSQVLASRTDPVLISIHSFTPQLRGRPARPWEVGVLFAQDRRLADPLIAALSESSAAPVGVNEPYAGHLPGDAVDRHALAQGRLNALVELRQDLIADPTGQIGWARTLAAAIELALGRI